MKRFLTNLSSTILHCVQVKKPSQPFPRFKQPEHGWKSEVAERCR